MDPKQITFLFLGPSGAGKDTQADKLVEQYGFQKIASGDVIRDYLAQDKVISEKLKNQYLRGEWADDEELYLLLETGLSTMVLADKLILVGFVRRPTQIPLFTKLLEQLNRELNAVVLFEVSAQAATKRLLQRQRKDDKPKAIARRLDNYNKTIRPIVEHYKELGKLIRIDANHSIEEVFSVLRKELSPYLS